MDKLEVLVRLDLLDSELSHKENMLKEWCNKCDDRNQFLYHYIDKMSGIKWAREALEKARSAIVYAYESPEITEVYPHCKSEVTLYWDVKDRGYKAFCPVCGERVDTRLRWVYMLTSKNNRNNKNN